jgi:cold shock CspA family protein
MSKSQETFGKKEKEKKRLKKRKEKAEKREERKENSKGGGLANMLAYVDEFGNISDTPPDPENKVEIELEDIEISVRKKEIVEDDPIKTGKVDFFNTEKGFGFIKETGTNQSFFVHVKGLIDEIKENDKVSFELEKGLKGWNAVRVTKI